MKQTYKIGNKVVTKKQFEASNKHLVSLDSVVRALPEHTEGQTSEARHTPTPWTIITTDRGDKVLNYSDGELRSHVATLHDIALCPEHGTVEANAAFIVRAVNSYDEFKRKADAHDELVHAVKFAKNVIDNACGQLSGDEAKRIHTMMLKALEKAEIGS